MIERRYDCRAALRRNLRRDVLAVVAITIVQNDLRAEGSRVELLDLGRVPGHNDGRPDTEPLGGERDTLPVISRRKSDDASAAFRVTELQKAVERAANLESAAVLQRFGLDENPGAGALIQDVGFEHRCCDQPIPKPATRLLDIGHCRQHIRHTVTICSPFRRVL